MFSSGRSFYQNVSVLFAIRAEFIFDTLSFFLCVRLKFCIFLPLNVILRVKGHFSEKRICIQIQTSDLEIGIYPNNKYVTDPYKYSRKMSLKNTQNDLFDHFKDLRQEFYVRWENSDYGFEVSCWDHLLSSQKYENVRLCSSVSLYYKGVRADPHYHCSK